MDMIQLVLSTSWVLGPRKFHSQMPHHTISSCDLQMCPHPFRPLIGVQLTCDHTSLVAILDVNAKITSIWALVGDTVIWLVYPAPL